MWDLFNSATSFNGDISKWDVSSVSNMGWIFADATSFNGDISKWHVSSVTEMSGMFYDATSFTGNISKWQVSSVTIMNRMFHGATSFNSDISKWDVSSVTDMSGMFAGASAFNGDISKWNVLSVKSMGWMFAHAISFNGDISKWDVSNLQDISSMFHGAKAFEQTLCGAWAYSKAQKNNMFQDSHGSMCTTTTSTTTTTSITTTSTTPTGKHANYISTSSVSKIRPRIRIFACTHTFGVTPNASTNTLPAHTASLLIRAECPSWCEQLSELWTIKCSWTSCDGCAPCYGMHACVCVFECIGVGGTEARCTGMWESH